MKQLPDPGSFSIAVSRDTMKGKEHMNFQAYDEHLGPALISIKDVSSEDGLQMTHMILRLSIGTFQQYFYSEDAGEPDAIAESARKLCPRLSIKSQPIVPLHIELSQLFCKPNLTAHLAQMEY